MPDMIKYVTIFNCVPMKIGGSWNQYHSRPEKLKFNFIRHFVKFSIKFSSTKSNKFLHCIKISLGKPFFFNFWSQNLGLSTIFFIDKLTNRIFWRLLSSKKWRILWPICEDRFGLLLRFSMVILDEIQKMNYKKHKKYIF